MFKSLLSIDAVRVLVGNPAMTALYLAAALALAETYAKPESRPKGAPITMVAVP